MVTKIINNANIITVFSVVLKLFKSCRILAKQTLLLLFMQTALSLPSV